jgi:F0F1-type ATP synthase assembly protein I
MAVKPKADEGIPIATLNLWAIASELGIKIAGPLLIFMLIGIKLDRMWHTTPLFMLLGMGLAFSTTVYLVVKMVRDAARSLR